MKAFILVEGIDTGYGLKSSYDKYGMSPKKRSQPM